MTRLLGTVERAGRTPRAAERDAPEHRLVPRRAVITAGLLSCDDGEFHTVTVTSPDGVAGVVLAGTVVDLTRVLRAGLAVLPDEAGR